MFDLGKAGEMENRGQKIVSSDIIVRPAPHQGSGIMGDGAGKTFPPTRPSRIHTHKFVHLHSAKAPPWSEVHLRAATYAAGVALWSWNVRTDEIAMDELAYALWDLPNDGSELTFTKLSANIHPADLDCVRSHFSATRAEQGSFEIDFRIITHDEIRWISARGQGGDADIGNGLVFGVFLDVTKGKRAEEDSAFLAGEMRHRVKNLIQIATSLTRLTSSGTTSKEEMTEALTNRLMALGRAQDVVRATPGNADTTPIADLLAILLSPYGEAGSQVRMRLAVPNITLGPDASTAVALVIHELATNSAKYGALSRPDGTLELSGEASDCEVVFTWVERGGPPVCASPSGGYGSKLLRRYMETQLGGSVSHNWTEDGLVVVLRMRSSLLDR